MPSYEAQILKQRTDANAASLNGWPLLRTRHQLQRAPCWSESQKVEMIDTVLRDWVAPPVYVIERPDLTDTVTEGEQHVFDGAHKLEAVFEFMSDVYPLRKTQTSCAEIQEYDGKRFSELPLEIRMRIRRYMFVVNLIDVETVSSPDQLQTLWDRLNRSGKKINNFELTIPTIGLLLERVIRPAMKLFMGGLLFPATESKRGALEQRLMLILAIYDETQPGTSYSQNKIVSAWHAKIGRTMEQRSATIAARAEEWTEVLQRVQKMLTDMHDLNTFTDAEGVSLLHDAHIQTELPLVLGRLALRFKRIENFRHKKAEICTALKNTLFSKTPRELVNAEGAGARNSTYQKRILTRIYGLVDELAGEKPTVRLFTAKQKKAKLEEQGGKCAGCDEAILPHQVYEGDHKVPWSEGGATSFENLQILHAHCHQKKTAASH